MKLVLSASLLACVVTQGASAQLLTDESVRSIERLANLVCNSLEVSGSSSTVSIDANAAAEARAILRILAGAEGGLDVDAFISKYENVPRKELTAHLKSAQDCRLEVFRSARDEVAKARAAATPQDDKLVWAFPHMVREGIALGVINVRPHGSGIDINYRLRNVRNEAVHVKFAGMSYTDETGNVCQKGSLTTGVTGIAWGKSAAPSVLPPGNSIQFSGNNIRCDGSAFGETGDILATIATGTDSNQLKSVKFEIAGVNVVSK